MKWLYANTVFIPVIINHFKEKITYSKNNNVNKNITIPINHTSDEYSIDIDYYENLFRS